MKSACVDLQTLQQHTETIVQGTCKLNAELWSTVNLREKLKQSSCSPSIRMSSSTGLILSTSHTRHLHSAL